MQSIYISFRKSFLLLCPFFILVSQLANAFTNEEIVISDKLTENADAVIHKSDRRFIISDIDKTEYFISEKITVLNKNVDDFGLVVQGYDDDTKIKSISASVFDKNGKEIQSLKSKDFKDYSAIEGFTLYSDSRVLVADLRQDEYPYTISYEIELKKKYYYSIPPLIVNRDFNVAVEESSYYLEYPQALKPRIKIKNIEQGKYVHTSTAESERFVFNNLKAIQKEVYAPSISAVSPVVLISPSKFSYDKYEGDKSTWDGMAAWQAKLNSDLDGLTDITKTEVKQITKGLSETEKVFALYRYMQKRTRYVSIQLGIGGLRPFSPEMVDENGYGDCKALSFFMKALLKEAGIESYYSYIYGGRKPPEVDSSFPYDNFNHIVLAVPVQQDTIWLECTSQSISPGYLGSFTSSRYAVSMTDEGKAYLLKTPDYDSLNTVHLKSEVILGEDGSAEMQLNGVFEAVGTEYGGLDNLHNENESRRKSWFRSLLDVPNIGVESYDFNKEFFAVNQIEIPVYKTEANYKLRRLAVPTNEKLILDPNVIKTWTPALGKDDNRSLPISIRYTNNYAYKIEIQIPDGYQLKDYPGIPTKLITDYGNYSLSYYYDEETNRLQCEKSLSVNDGVYPPDEYKPIQLFFEKIRGMEMQEFILEKI